MNPWLLTAAGSYLLGSIPFGYLLVRIFRGEDVRESGSKNIGATNVSRKSPALGILTLLLDAIKGTAAVWFAHILHERLLHENAGVPLYPLLAVAALFAVTGHIFPVWLKFRGGKGVATGLGSFAVMAPKAVLVAVGIFLIIVALFRRVSLGSILAVALFPVWVRLWHEYGGSPLALRLVVLTSLLIIFRHHENILRLLRGREKRLGWKAE
jgi:glycerol-3-phosphate acyltransferase PlsY